MPFQVKHGGSRTGLYRVWRGMRERCGHSKGAKLQDLQNYHDKGIRVCKEWLESFEAFRDWALNNGYQEGLLLDRKENDKGYNPDNCRWVSFQDSNRNKRNVRLTFEIAEEIRKKRKAGASPTELAGEYDLSASHVVQICKNKLWAKPCHSY